MRQLSAFSSQVESAQEKWQNSEWQDFDGLLESSRNHLPVNAGSFFSMNALVPMRKSSVTRVWCSGALGAMPLRSNLGYKPPGPFHVCSIAFAKAA